MSDIIVQNDVPESELKEKGIRDWPVWEKEVSEFPWTYSSSETCFFLDGDVVVTPDGGEPVEMGQGDLVTFPAGMSCRWNIRSAVRKHYSFSD